MTADLESHPSKTKGGHRALKGDLKGWWGLTVTGNWRSIFRYDEQTNAASRVPHPSFWEGWDATSAGRFGFFGWQPDLALAFGHNYFESHPKENRRAAHTSFIRAALSWATRLPNRC
jgi:hypothetical protein